MFKVLKDYCHPVRGTKYSAYVDLFSAEDCTIGAGETKIVKLGVKIDLDGLYRSWYFYTEQNNISGSWEMFLKSHYLEVALRSSLGVKGLIIANGTGKVDLDYPDEIGLIVHNPIQLSSQKYEILVNGGVRYLDKFYAKGKDFKISKGDKVAQCTLKEHKGYLMGYESDVVRTGGFGSTDNKVEAPIFDKPDFFRCNELN